MQKQVSDGKDTRTVDFTVTPYGAVKYRFTAFSKAKKPVPYIFEGTFETYVLDRNGDEHYPHFKIMKAEGVGGWRYSSHAVRERFAHVVRFIRFGALKAAAEFYRSPEYAAAYTQAKRDALVRKVGEAQRQYRRAVRELDSSKDSLALAEKELEIFNERHGTAPSNPVDNVTYKRNAVISGERIEIGPDYTDRKGKSNDG